MKDFEAKYNREKSSYNRKLANGIIQKIREDLNVVSIGRELD